MGDIKMNENLENLFAKLFFDKSLAQGFSQCKTIDEFYNFCISIEKGYTKEELIAAIDMLGTFDWRSVLEQEESEELDSEDLESVAGGANFDVLKKSFAGFLGLLTLGTSIFLTDTGVKASDSKVAVLKNIERKIKSKVDRIPRFLKYVLTAAGFALLVYTAKNFSRRSTVPNNIIGFSNPGNACYINASLQQLYSIAEFRIRVMNDKSGDEKIEALKTVFKSLDDAKPLDRSIRNKALKILGYEGTQESAHDFMTFNKYIGDVCEKLGLSVDALPFTPSKNGSFEDYFKDSANMSSLSMYRDQIIIPFSCRPSDVGIKDFKIPQKVDVLGSTKYLTGAIVKTGGSYRGHYTSYKKMADGSWYHYNDSYVTKVTEEEVNRNISNNVTVVVYSS